MSPVDPFKPQPGLSYSKTAVDRAARLLMAWYAAPYDPDNADLAEATLKVSWWRHLHAKPLAQVSANLRYYVAEVGPVIVTQRLKRRGTMVDKLAREPKMNLTRMADIGGVRARLQSIEDIYSVTRRLKKNWTVVQTRDYIADPKESGYRAMHLIVRRNGYLVEVQLRTMRQDAWANQVEDDSRLHVDYKSGFGDPAVHAYYVTVAEMFEHMDHDRDVPEELITRLLEQRGAAQPILRPAEEGE